MAQTKKPQLAKVDVAELQHALQQQFTNLDPKDPSLWPLLPRTLLCVFIAAAVAALLWFAWLTDFEEELKNEQAQEVTLRADYQKKLMKSNCPAKQRWRPCCQTSTRPAWAEACNLTCSDQGRLWCVTITQNCPLQCV